MINLYVQHKKMFHQDPLFQNDLIGIDWFHVVQLYYCLLENDIHIENEYNEHAPPRTCLGG